MNAITESVAALAATATQAEPVPLGHSLLNFVARAMTNPTINIDKLEALLRMQREIMARDAKQQFHRAMSAAQGEMQPVVRDAENKQTSSRYARLETIDAAIRPIYARHGFSLSFDSEPTDGPDLRIVCEVAHEAGHTRTYHLDAPPDLAGAKGNVNKTPLHALGSTISYLRRYLTCMIFNITLRNEDDDGNRTPPATRDTRLSLDQLAVLSDLMRKTRTEEARFLAIMAPGLASIEDAPSADFPRLKNALLTKQNVLAQRHLLAIQQARQADAARQARAPTGQTG